MKIRLAAVAILLSAGMPAIAHRLDEYLQGVIISVEKSSLHAQITLTPGVAVLPAVLSAIDTDADGILSETEQRAYAGQALRDLSLTVDGDRRTLQLLSLRFPTLAEMKEGIGEIQIESSADLPPGGPERRLILENHHQSRISAYQVNCLVPRDPDIRIVAQNRNYSQSLYEVAYAQANVRSDWLSLRWWSDERGWVVAVALFLSARFGLLWRRRTECELQLRPRSG